MSVGTPGRWSAGGGAAKLRELELPDTKQIHGRTYSEWLDWAEAKAIELDPVTKGTETIVADIAQVSAWTQLE